MKFGFMKSAAAVCAALFAAVVMAQAAQAAPTVIKFAGQNPPEHHATLAMNAFAKEVNEKTKGRLQVKVYPSNQLGDYEGVYEELMQGTIEMSCCSFTSKFDNRMDLIYVQGYTASYKQVAKVYDPNGWFFKKMAEFQDKLGVKLLGMYLEGMVGMCTTKEIKHPLDPTKDHGVLMRIPNMDVFKTALDGGHFRTISIPFADVYQSMQTGVCDGDTGYSIVAAYTALGDVIKHWYNYNKNTECLAILISGKTWAKLSPEDQKIVKAAAEKMAAKSITTAQKEDQKYLDLMRKKGIKVHMFTPQETKPMFDAFAETWKKLDSTKGKELMAEFKTEMKKISDSLNK